ncbi:ribosome small subunit-dependent GTPase A [Desulfomarina sp.]
MVIRNINPNIKKNKNTSRQEGTLVAHLGVAVEIRFDATGEKKIIRVKRNSGHVVGDRVTVNNDLLIRHKRKSKLVRVDARGKKHCIGANLDAVCIVAACEPLPPPGFIDRAVIAARAAHLRPILLINKCDLPGSGQYEKEIRKTYADPVSLFILSAVTGAGINQFTAGLAGLRSIFVGPTGVGKSSLLNRICPAVNLQTGALHESRKRGRHTTTVSTLHRLKGGGELIDSPGFIDFGLADIPITDLAFHFPGFERSHDTPCRFRNCLHRSEPGCTITSLLEQGRITRERYETYLQILHELEALENQLRYREMNKRRKK